MKRFTQTMYAAIFAIGLIAGQFIQVSMRVDNATASEATVKQSLTVPTGLEPIDIHEGK